MRIINKGIDIETEVRVTCKSCRCEFAYTKQDVHHDQRDGDYVICPWCNKFISHNYVANRF